MRKNSEHILCNCYCTAEMEYLRGYGSDSDCTDGECEESDCCIEVAEASLKQASSSHVGQPTVRQVYLITYSQRDLQKFPTQQSFAEAVVSSFSGSNANIVQWVCSKQAHKNKGYHHMAIKLDRIQRWLASQMYLNEHHRISVNFSD